MGKSDSTASMQGLRVLVVEDEEDISGLIRIHLEGEGFLVSVSENGLDAWNRIERSLPDLVLLDLMLPGMSGLDLCKKIKAKYDVPILMVTARNTDTDAVIGLELGADDYIRKPFSPRELTARVRAVLRRRETEGAGREGAVTIGKVYLDPSGHKVTVDGKEVDLSLIEYRILKLFLENPDIAFTRDRLLDRIWGRDVYVSDRTVDVNIKRLRDKLGEEKERLETIRGVGYRFRGESSAA